ncbi:MAG: hypothetical protein V7603_6654 [Micromonosporaceae bacterium]
MASHLAGPLVDLVPVAQRYVDRVRPRRRVDVARIGRLTPRPDPAFCRRVADHFDRAPLFQWNSRLRRRYALLQSESLRQYQAIVDAGIEVLPWLAPGQPYRDSAHLRESVRRSGRLYVFLTRDGHGPGGSPPDHPMSEPSGVRVAQVDLCHNDIFRAVHDVFGHVMFGNSMGPAGEFRAAYSQMAMYPDGAHPVLFTEQVSQICWFFYGPHLRDDAGRLPARGAPGWVPPRHRPYPEQKVFACPPEFLARFTASVMEEDRCLNGENQ